MSFSFCPLSFTIPTQCALMSLPARTQDVRLSSRVGSIGEGCVLGGSPGPTEVIESHRLVLDCDCSSFRPLPAAGPRDLPLSEGSVRRISRIVDEFESDTH